MCPLAGAGAGVCLSSGVGGGSRGLEQVSVLLEGLGGVVVVLAEVVMVALDEVVEVVVVAEVVEVHLLEAGLHRGGGGHGDQEGSL